MEIDLDHPARARLARDLLAWGEPRPPVPHHLTATLVDDLERGIASLGGGLVEAADAARRGRVAVTKSTLERLVCDGWQLEPRPFAHTRASVRGTLVHKAVERDREEGRGRTSIALVRGLWAEEASRRPGDPASLSRWLNHLPAPAAAELCREVADLLDAFREVWPPLPAALVRPRVERQLEVVLADGRVVLQGVPDLVFASPVADDRARTLVVDLKTGRPRPDLDRQQLRFYALLVTLADGRPPFRWATYHVTEGRTEVEDLDEAVLRRAAGQVVEALTQQVRLAAGTDDLALAGGPWCAFCARQDHCPVADRGAVAAP